MSSWEDDNGHDIITIFWVKKLIYNARPIGMGYYWRSSPEAWIAAERAYDLFLENGPPLEAIIDFQRERVYRWEANIIYPKYPSMLWEDCNIFFENVWRSNSKKSLPLLLRDKRVHPSASDGIIHLCKNDNGTWNKGIILHEISHILTPGHQHGPKFVKTYIKLCCRHLEFEKRELEDSARVFGVKF
jgi:hypothetical protein